ncbi:MAG: sigma-54-dependent transcriptional regulator [Janthinobacterium lividum]
MPHALIVDDDANTRAALAELITSHGITVAQAEDLRQARIQLVRQIPDVLFTDLKLPDGQGIELMDDLEKDTNTDFIVITGHASVESAVEALKLGAVDYLVKPLALQRVTAILKRLPRTGELKAQVESLRGELRRFGRFGRLLGRSPSMQTLYDQIGKIAPTAASVLLTGESGTGKELVSRTLHDLSVRRKRAFIAVNCGAISPNLIESEMFGHERGSFTGADRQHKGYFERANGGTLFLDEITEMPIELQVKLLRVLETGAFIRLGTTKEIDTDVRIIAATNRDPQQAVLQGKLREDLYHRLNVFPLILPPLRERGDDIRLLAEHFLNDLNAQYSTRKRFAPPMLDALCQHAWPGNVRELKNHVERAHIMAEEEIDARPSTAPSVAAASAASSITVPVGTSLDDANRELIYATLSQCGGVKTRAAEILGVSLKTLYNRLAQYEDEADAAES